MKKERELLKCDECGKDDCRGTVGLAIHRMRVHQGKNWSTRRKPAEAQ
jgi:hypothetical protein